VRQSPGGDNHHNAALVDLLVENRSVPAVVLTDRVTFSAASNLVTDIEQATDAVFVGEAMGGGLNFWNDVDFVQLDALPVARRSSFALTVLSRGGRSLRAPAGRAPR
jgi:hypothetical protein